MQKILENALEIGRKYIPEGECASYIPELAKADKNHLGVCIRTRGMETFSFTVLTNESNLVSPFYGEVGILEDHMVTVTFPYSLHDDGIIA